MARDPQERPATAAEFGEQLREVQRRHGIPVDDMPVPIAAPATVTRTPTPSTGTLRSDYPSRTLTPPTPTTRFRMPVSTKALGTAPG
jgi:serine/threonine-protein kinase PknK